MTDLVQTEISDRVAILTLNDPKTRNPLTGTDMIEALIASLLAVDADPEVRAVILTGAGKAFSTGGNIAHMVVGGGLVDEDPALTIQNYRRGIQRIPLTIDAMEVPIIAAVNGPAVGAGCDLACMCDMRIAAEGATFAESFVKLGLVPGDGGAWFLPRVIGQARASEMAFTGDAVTARQALEMGLVSRVVPDADLMAEARTLADRIAGNPRSALRMAKRLIMESRSASLASLLEQSAALQAVAHTTEAHKSAVAAFLQRKAK